jgi:hypothetical protein
MVTHKSLGFVTHIAENSKFQTPIPMYSELDVIEIEVDIRRASSIKKKTSTPRTSHMTEDHFMSWATFNKCTHQVLVNYINKPSPGKLH